jgi:hypothetical protein
MAEIERLLEHDTAGDPMTGLRWMRKTTEKVATQLSRLGIQVRSRGKISWTFGPKHFKLSVWLRSPRWRRDMLSWVLT